MGHDADGIVDLQTPRFGSNGSRHGSESSSLVSRQRRTALLLQAIGRDISLGNWTTADTYPRPILTPKTVLPLFFGIGIIFAPIGGLLLYASSEVRLRCLMT